MCLLHLVMLSLISSSFWGKIQFIALFKSTDRVNPNMLKLDVSHLNFKPPNFSLQCFFFRIQTMCVLSLFIFSPEILPNISKVFWTASKESRVPSKNNVVSSVNCVSLISQTPHLIPFILGLFIIIKFIIWSAQMKR